MDRDVRRLRDMLAPRSTQIIYNGFWFSPEMEFIGPAFRKRSELIDGEVRLGLFEGNVLVERRGVQVSLDDQHLTSMDIAGGYDQRALRGLIRVNARRLTAHRLIYKGQGEDDWPYNLPRPAFVSLTRHSI